MNQLRSLRSEHIRSICQQVLCLDHTRTPTMASSFAATNTKKIRLFRNGDENFFGKTLVLNPRQIRSYDRLLETVTSHVGFGQAVRSIRTPRYGTMVHTLDDLEDQQDYVAVGIGRFKNIGYGCQFTNIVHIKYLSHDCLDLISHIICLSLRLNSLFGQMKQVLLSSRINVATNRRRHHHRVASSGRHVAPPWPRRMACLQRLAGTDPESLRSWSVQRARGRPRRRLQSPPNERPMLVRLGKGVVGWSPLSEPNTQTQIV